MKHHYKVTLFVFIVSIIFLGELEAQSKSFNQFYRQFHWSENSVKVTVPGLLIRMGAGIAKNHLENELEKSALKHAKKIKKIKVLVLEGNKAMCVEDKSVKKLISGIENEKFETLVSVREGGETVKLFVKMKKDCIHNLIVIVDDDDEFVAVNLKTKLKMEDLGQFLRDSEFDFNM